MLAYAASKLAGTGGRGGPVGDKVPVHEAQERRWCDAFAVVEVLGGVDEREERLEEGSEWLGDLYCPCRLVGVGAYHFDRDRACVVGVGDLGGQVLQFLLLLGSVGVLVFPEVHVEAEEDALQSEAYLPPCDGCANRFEEG